MRSVGYVFVVLVGVINILLNTFALKSAMAAQNNLAVALPDRHGFAMRYKAAVLSRPFKVAFLVGLCSLFGLVAVYVSGIPLARGILLMGATSIVGGALFGARYQGVRLAPVEWCLLFAIAVFYGWRFMAGLLGPR